MTLPLSELQSTFAQALHYKATGEDCDIVSNHFTADERIQIYRNHFVVSLKEILQLTYPNVLSLIGQECFEGLARFHVLSVPLTEGDVSSYGCGFAETIESVDSVIDTVPYLSDIARLEWAIDKCNQKQSNPEPLPNLHHFDQLSNFDSQQQASITLVLNKSLAIVNYKYAAFSILDGIKNNDFSHLEVDKAECGIIWFPTNEEVQLQKINVQQYHLLQQISANTTLGNIEQRLLTHLPELISLNLFVGFQVEKNSGVKNVV